MFRKKYFGYKHALVILFTSTFLITFFITKAYTKGNEATVILDDDGFSVQSISIEKGTIVRWKIEGGNSHWPASDLHPSHGEYPEGGGCIGSKLDACRELKNGEVYAFRFDRAGMWSMHDHLFHGNTMVIVVKEQQKAAFPWIPKSWKAINRAKNINNTFDFNLVPEKISIAIKEKCLGNQDCYMSAFKSLTKKRGYIFAFEAVDELKEVDKNIASNCHRLAHGIGWTAYEVDPARWKENLRKINPGCNWGALHGIVEQYVAENKKLDDVTIKTLCGGEGACNHGIGHMLLVQTNNDIPKALDICTVLATQMERHMCMTGIFMERMTLQNLVDKENDSSSRRQKYWQNRLSEFQQLCETFQGAEHSACWEEVARPAAANFNMEPQKALNICNNSSTQDGARYCRRRAVSEIISRKKLDMKGMKYICESAPDYDSNFPRDCYLRIAHLAYVSLPESRRNEISAYCREIPVLFTRACDDLVAGASLTDSISENSLN